MPDPDEQGSGYGRAATRRREGLLSAFASWAACALERESDRWFLWLPVLFAGGIIAYFALADEPGLRIPTVRSWIMMSIVLIAVMLDRPAITMRNVALAALLILVVAPESLFDPSFEMLFAAVIALVAVYEWPAARNRRGASDVSPIFRGLRKGGSLIGGAGLTTLVAGTAIALCALPLPPYEPSRAVRQSDRRASDQPPDYAHGLA